jgi:hypothetical protein
MSRIAGLLILAAVVLLLTGCPGQTKADLPKDTVVKPTIVYVDRDVYVPIKSELTREQPIADGPLDQCPIVAHARKTSLQKANAQLREIGGIQGAPVQP